jgi:hypothetical protein
VLAGCALGGTALGGTAQADAVVKLYGSKITVYRDHNGREILRKLKRSRVILPAQVTSRESSRGLVQAQFRFKDGAEKTLIGWVRKRSIKLDSRAEIDIGGCSAAKAGAITVRRGTRGLGDRC